jgi:quinol monooxygenase YgiN
MTTPVDVLCLYRVKPGEEATFRELLTRHGSTLRAEGLLSPEPTRVMRSTDRSGRAVFLESFQWRDASAADVAHRSSRVMAVWGPMEQLCEEMEFLDTLPV